MFVFVFVLLFLQTTGTIAFTVTTSTPVVNVPENQGADLKCSYSADFGTPRIEWKFKAFMDESQTLVVFDGEPTAGYAGRVELYTGGLRFNRVTRADNGEYTCEVSSAQGFGEATIKLVVQVPPSKPMCRVPASVTTGRSVTLTCYDRDGSPPCTYKWFKDNTPLPDDPSKFPAFRNSTFTVDTNTGDLVFPHISKLDSGEYFCTASNGAGPPQSCAAIRMAVQLQLVPKHYTVATHCSYVTGRSEMIRTSYSAGTTCKTSPEDLNKGGIAAGVIIALLALGLLAFGLWYAHRKGYLPKKSESKPRALYQPPSDYVDEEDGEFRQKSSFVV